VEMPRDSGIIIAKRSVNLGKTYVVIGAGLAIFGISLSNVLGTLPSSGVPSGSIPSNVDIASAIPFISIPLLVFAALSFSMPVQLLYVYDRNNGVLEYFLSLGMDQGDVYKGYLKAALLLASILLSFEIVANVLVGLAFGVDRGTLAFISILATVIALGVVSFVTMLMMAFSSLQKQRTGSNQPLGIALGVFLVIPAYAIPLVFPSLAIYVDLVLAAVIMFLSLSVVLLASRLIRREKLLP
jgi:hypothetical protein